MGAWVLRRSVPQEPYRWLVQCLDDAQQVRPCATERYCTKEGAMARARFQNKQGHNVQVVCEHAYCEREGA